MQSRANIISSGSPARRTQRSKAGHSLSRLAAALALAGAWLLPSRMVSAQVAADAPPRLDERTAHTVGGQHLKLGLLAVEYGVTDRFAVGVDPPAWAARAVLPFLIPNLHAKAVLIDQVSFALSIRGAGYYADLKREDNAPGSLVAVPVSLFASIRLAPRWWLHGEGTYLYAHAFGGGGDLDDADLNGAVATRSTQLGAMLEYRATRVVSLTALGRYQAYSGPLVFSGTATLDPYTTAEVEGELRPRVEHPWQAVGGVAFLWPVVRIVLGVGYGHYFIPGFTIALPDRTIVPDLSVSVVL
jgi:hypothetical protein